MTPMGSSPRVRGSLWKGPGTVQVIGIIPAGAGLTFPHSRGNALGRDHPRGCGAHILYESLIVYGLGSSPRVRGSLFKFVNIALDIGIIPAGAGLTESALGVIDAARDHPRGCGAHPVVANVPPCGQGSSPRVRGSRRVGCCPIWIPGIIPAGAGLTHSLLIPA